MKLSLWMCALCLFVVTLFLRIWLYYLDHLVLDLLTLSGREGLQLPRLTELCFTYRKWIPLAAVPWIFVAICRSRATLSGERLVQFAASAALAAVLLGTFCIVSSLLPFPELIIIRQIGYSGSW